MNCDCPPAKHENLDRENMNERKRERIQGARSVFEKAKAAKNNLSQSSVEGQQIKKPRMTKVVTTLKRSKGRFCFVCLSF